MNADGTIVNTINPNSIILTVLFISLIGVLNNMQKDKNIAQLAKKPTIEKKDSSKAMVDFSKNISKVFINQAPFKSVDSAVVTQLNQSF